MCRRVGNQKRVGFPMNHLRPKRFVKAMKKISESISEKCIELALKSKAMFGAWCLKEVAEFQHFCTACRGSWKCKTEVVI